MSLPSIIIHDAITGQTVQREMTPDEFAQYEVDQAASEAAAAEAEEAAATQAAARQALLDRLGITEAEARLLLGNPL